jgi:hypothetical protein
MIRLHPLGELEEDFMRRLFPRCLTVALVATAAVGTVALVMDAQAVPAAGR